MILDTLRNRMATECHIIERLSDDLIAQLHSLYQGEWWSQDRRLADVRRMLSHSPLVIALVEPDAGRLIGFTRVLTDFTYRAILFDVIVHPERRGERLGDVLVRTVVEHPRLTDVKQFELYCRPDLVPYYKRLGFTDELEDLRFMRFQRA